MSSLVTDLDTLQGHVGRLPAPRDLKVIDFLDDHALRWLVASPFMFATFGDSAGLGVTAGGGEAGFLRVTDPGYLQLPMSLLDDPNLAREGQGFGSLFLVPGMDETLRINGRVRSVADGHIGVAVEECYLHCAKAFMRSDFWNAQPLEAKIDAATYVERSRFMALATMNNEGRADVSPKGDPAGALLKAHENAVWYPDRPGNRRVDSFRNI
jgi:predicted pyridoxine 5'-phosphate oxidase superfamily flavin-nucleotide-binding protein